MPLSLRNLAIAAVVKITLLGIAPAYAAGSAEHSAQSVEHSGGAVSHGAAAVASGAATAVAVPMVSVGSAAAGSGAAIEAAGTASVTAGGDIIDYANGPLPFDADEMHLDRRADPAPRLD
ncbi:MAG: hypothetical protein R3F54_12890 [Alphaproteobacteria bacterium]